MGNRKPLDEYSAYELQSRLSDYNSMVKNLDEYALSEEEEELMSEFNQFYPDIANELEDLFSFVHENIEKGHLNTDEIDENITSLINRIGYYSDIRHNMKSACKYESNDYSVMVKGINYILQNSIEKESYTAAEDNREDDSIKGIIKSQANRVHNIIVNNNGPVTREYLATMIDGLHNQAVYFATCYDDILNYRGLYIADKNIEFTEIEKNELFLILTNKLNQKNTIHAQELFDSLGNRYKDLFRRAYIKTPYHLFSFLQHYYSKSFYFVRPFVANFGTEIAPMEQVKAFMEDYDEIPVEEYFDFLKENHIKIYTLIDSIEQVQDVFILKNKKTLIRQCKTGLGNNEIQTVKNLIGLELEDDPCKAVRDLKCIYDFPKINVPWDEWLIFSLVRKYANNFEALLSTLQYRTAIPIIAKLGCADSKAIELIAKTYFGSENVENNGALENITDGGELDDKWLLYEDE